MKRKLFVFILLLLCFTKCQKENDQDNFCYSSTLISQVNSGDIAVQGLTYNSNCLIYESTEPFAYKRFTYNGQDKLTRIETALSFSAFSCVMIPGQSLESDPRKAEISSYSDFEYDESGKLIKQLLYAYNSGHPKLISYFLYDYDAGNVSKLSSFNPQGTLLNYYLYKFDDRGNMKEEKYYSSINSVIKLTRTTTCTFDDRINPYKVFSREGIPGKNTNLNNILSETTVSYFGNSESTDVRQHTYAYNNLDLPVKINSSVILYGK